MTITRISKQKKKNDRYNVYVDELYAFSISANDLLKSGLTSGTDVTLEKLDEYKRQASKSFLLEACLAYLSLRPHSTKEISQYIKRKAYSNKEIKENIGKEIKKVTEEITSYLKDRNYINDTDFASWLISQRNNSRSPRSISHIKSELYQKGISSEIIEKSLTDNSPSNESDKAKILADKKFKQLKARGKNAFEIKKALYSHLAQKGFSWETIQPIVDTYIDPQYNIE